MNRFYLKTLACLLTGILLATSRGATNVQDAVIHTVGSGDQQFSFLLVEGESFESETNPAEDTGFVAVDNSEARTNALGNPVLRKLTSASGQGALYTMTGFAPHSDKVTYKVKFATAGTYYLYMRFTMFENGGNTNVYLNEDSFFVPPDFNKDPQNDWPLPPDGSGGRAGYGGYTEGCCDGGFLSIPGDDGIPVSHNNTDAAGRAYFEGNFHWNELKSSQFLAPSEGTPRMKFQYVVTEAQVGQTLDFTVGYREGGVTIDAFMFATDPDLMTKYKQSDLDRMLLNGVAVQEETDVIGTGDTASSFLLLEAENYIAKANPVLEAGFTRVDDSGLRTNFLGNGLLATNTTASGDAALTGQTIFAEHGDKVTYRVQFVTPGTYYLYMRFTMFENGGNVAHYLNEDSFFVPPDFGADPQTGWPLPRGGYVEGCCDGGFLNITERGIVSEHRNGDEAGRQYWEGNFHWNLLQTSQFNNPETQGEPRLRIKYEVTAEDLNKPLDFTISYREGGLTIDAFLFSTDPDLLQKYNGFDMDHFFVNPVSEQEEWNVVGEGETAWSFFKLEAEDYDKKQNLVEGAGWTWVDNTGYVTNFLGNPVLSTNSTASGGGALFGRTIFGEHADKVTYQVQFARAGTYYLYMRFTMFENGGNVAHYLNEDSFFVPPDFGKDPQTDWPLPRGGYVEGCCDGGFLNIMEDGVVTERRNGDEAGRAFWEGNFHWNFLQTSQFNNPETQGEPRLRIKYEVTEGMVGKPLEFTISYREGGFTPDFFFFSTNPDLMQNFSNAEMDQTILGIEPGGLRIATTFEAGVLTLSWPAASGAGFVLESVGVLPALETDWQVVPDAPTPNGADLQVTVTAPTGSKYYRLKKAP